MQAGPLRCVAGAVTTRANWFTGEGELSLHGDPDPFQVPVEEVGEAVDLRDPAAKLELRLRELLHREARLFEREITCAIKDDPLTTCHACPVSKAHDPSEPLSTLCKIGREQEVVLTELAVLRWQGH